MTVKYAYYPGCSLEASSASYDVSTKAVAQRLDIELREIDDWNCCGATEYFTLHRLAAESIIARNLALVDADLNQLVAPCSACFLNLKKTDKLMKEDAKVCGKVNEALAAGGLRYTPGRIRVRHLLEVVYSDVGEEAVRKQVTHPLKGVRVAPYYGCQIVRPLNGFDDPEYPVSLDRVMTWLGAEVVDYPEKSHCCGGHMTQISEPQAFELIRRLLQSAADYNADVIACLCPMCQLNLDAYQARVNSFFNTQFTLPTLFFTELIGLAFGIAPEMLGIGKEIVLASPVLTARIGQEIPKEEKPKRPAGKGPELPWPGMK